MKESRYQRGMFKVIKVLNQMLLINNRVLFVKYQKSYQLEIAKDNFLKVVYFGKF